MPMGRSVGSEFVDFRKEGGGVWPHVTEDGTGVWRGSYHVTVTALR